MTLSAPNVLVGSSSTADAATYNTAAFTATAGSLLLLIFTGGKAANLSQAPTGATYNGSGMTLVQSQAVPNNNLTTSIWKAVGSGVSGGIAINHGITMDNGIWQVVQFTSDVATPTVKQMAANNLTGTGVQTVPLANGVTAGSCVIGALGFNSASTTVPAVGTGFTQLGSILTSTSPTTQQMLEYDNTSPFSTVGFNISSTGGRANHALEIADGVAAPSGPTATWWNGTAEVPATLSWWDGTNEVPVTFS